jgi:YHS domain-containing protein
VITAAAGMMLNALPKVKGHVGGMPMDPPNVAGESEPDGQTFSFCHAGWKQQFDQDSQH